MTTQLSYQPAFDPYHSAYRILRLLSAVKKNGRLPIDKIRLVDYYLLFPFRAEAIRLKREHRKYKAIAKEYEHQRPYSELPDDKTLFDRMAPMQEAAFETLAKAGLLSQEALNSGWIEAGAKPPPSLEARIAAANETDASLISFLELLLVDYELLGPDGLKARTQLLEHRYDAI
ncbi:hypothetical protein EOA30_17585 [Mesorhizobium sp. M8A.F.Ca.ET.059.01.1.1]|nr:hypothetical protein EOA30_17585 [Mesorhizobium sp. M8A.F.Ca.ET.059.01.1.1]